MANAGSKIVLEVEARNDTGKNACRRLRSKGKIPGNVYGLDRPPFMVAVSPKRIDELLRLGSGVNTIFSLTLVGESRTREAMIKELQRDPLTERPVHVDFVRVDPNRVMHVRVPVRLSGTPIGVRLEGAIVDFVHREVHVECLPAAIPEFISVEIGELHLNQHVSVKDLAPQAGVKVLDDPEQILVVVVAPKAEEAPAAEAEAAAAEPELVKKGKEPEGKEAPAKES
jgi:large subunit ribosomal protein L25